MRVRATLTALLAASSATAADLDCTALKTTRLPFAIDYEVTRVRDGKEVAAPTRETLQVFRGPTETVTYHVFAPGRFVRNRFVDPLFPLESAASNGTIVRRWKYSIDAGGGRLARREPLDFTTELINPDGTVFLQTASTIRFAGTAATEAQGCKFDVVRVMRTNDGTLQGKPSANRSEVWTSPDLQVNLFNRSNDGGFSSTYLVKGITTQFQRPE